MGSENGPAKSKANWVYATLPAAIATGPIGTLVQLYLIELNGNRLGTIYAGLAVAAFYLVGIPATIFWGYAADRYRSRRTILMSTYAAMSGVLVALYLIPNTGGIILVYSIFSFISAAAATPLNLLIMESVPKGGWATAFSKLSMVSGIGNSAGLVLSTIWVTKLPVLLLAIPLGLFSLVSAVLSLVLISEPKFNLERETMALRRQSFFSRLLSLPLLFLELPKLTDFRRLFRGLRSGITSYVPLLYISIVMFYFASGLFNTSFVPAQSTFSVSSGAILSVLLAGIVVQTIAFRYTGRYMERRSLSSASIQGLVLRGSCYVATGLFALFLASPLFFYPAIILYPLSSGLAFAVYYAASNTMVFNSIQNRKPGSALGVYSAIVGIATFAGALVSPFSSVYVGFYLTFAAAGTLLLCSALVVQRLKRFENPTNVQASHG